MEIDLIQTLILQLSFRETNFRQLVFRNKRFFQLGFLQLDLTQQDYQVKDYGQLFNETADDECCNEPDTVKVYQTEGTPFISYASSATDLRELGATGIDASKLNTRKMPSGHNGNGKLSTKSTNGNVKQLYTVHENDIDYTPMIFSRNSSVSSLESLDCPLDVNDADSVASEFSFFCNC